MLIMRSIFIFKKAHHIRTKRRFRRLSANAASVSPMKTGNQAIVKCSSICIFTIATLLTATGSASAYEAKKRSVVIQKVFVDSERNELDIIGKHFRCGRGVTVLLADEQLIVLSCHSHWIVANIPDGLESGDYLLTVRTGRGKRRIDRFDLTIPDALTMAPANLSLKVIQVEQQYLGRILGANSITGLEAVCPDGTVLTGGGVRQLAFSSPPPPTDTFDFFVGSHPFENGDPKRWIGLFSNPSSSPVTLNVAVSALCGSIETS